jgi:two-component system, OmpR family, sensor kinase
VKRLPIRWRVTIAFSGAMAVVLIALGLFVYLRVADRQNEMFDQSLHSRADDLAALVARSPGGLDSPAAGIDREESFAQVLRPDGTILDATPALDGHSLLTPAEAERAGHDATFVDRSSVPGLEGHARLLAGPAEVNGSPAVALVGASIDDREEALASLRTILLIGGPAALLLASLAGFLVAGTALRPVESMRRRAADITADEPDARLPLPPADDEIRRLGVTLNEMLGRLDTALARERAFVDDASHELRTPLAMHKTELELALRYAEGSEEMRAAIVSAIEEVDRLIGLAEDLLVLARSEQGKLPLDLGQMPAAELLGDLRERFAPRAVAAGRALAVEPADGLRLEVDRVRIEQALANLVENALQHGAGEIGLRVVAADGAVEIHVEDRGPGFPPEFIDRAFERFSRGDAARTGGGTGLGLAIVEAIARAHRGSAHARNRETGGADVWVRLPL